MPSGRKKLHGLETHSPRRVPIFHVRVADHEMEQSRRWELPGQDGPVGVVEVECRLNPHEVHACLVVGGDRAGRYDRPEYADVIRALVFEDVEVLKDGRVSQLGGGPNRTESVLFSLYRR